MWVIVMFDLPTDTKAARRQYSDFRKYLLQDGFSMMQYSVYVRHSFSRENAAVHSQRVKNMIPDDGEIRVLTITDKQFASMETFYGKIRRIQPKSPNNCHFFDYISIIKPSNRRLYDACIVLNLAL